jgi:hypothetical protein
MSALSSVGRGFRGHSHDHGVCRNILASSREDRHLPLALLDLIIYAACLRPRTLSIEVLQARAPVVTAFISLLNFTGPGLF